MRCDCPAYRGITSMPGAEPNDRSRARFGAPCTVFVIYSFFSPAGFLFCNLFAVLLVICYSFLISHCSKQPLTDKLTDSQPDGRTDGHVLDVQQQQGASSDGGSAVTI